MDLKSSEPPAPISAAAPRSSILTPLSIALVNRIGLMLFVYLGLTFQPGRGSSERLPGNFLLNGWVMWDAGWYAKIASDGYTNRPQPGNEERDTDFFPLYPLLVRGVYKLTGDVYLSGLIVSNVAFLCAAVLLFRLVEARWDSQLAQRTLTLMCVYPFSYVYSAMYAEGVFLLFSVGVFWFAERSRWGLAAACVCLAWATRFVAVASAAALTIAYLQNAHWRLKNVRGDAAWLLLSGVGVAAFLGFLWVRFNEPFAFISAQTAPSWNGIHTWSALMRVVELWHEAGFGQIASGDVPWRETIHLGCAAIAIALCIISWRRLPIAYAAWASIVVLISLTRWACFGRHFATVFPAFIVAAMLLKNQRLYHGVIYFSILLLALLALMFARGVWVA